MGPMPLHVASHGLFRLFSLVTVLVIFISFARLFVKAGYEWWEGIIPLYNLMVLFEIFGFPRWWGVIAFVLSFVPIANFVLWIYISVKLARCFNRGDLFIVGLVLLPIIFLPILAFDSASIYDASNCSSGGF